MTDLVERLLKRAEIRRQIPGRKSVEEGAADRIADLLEEAATAIAARDAILVALFDEYMNDEQCDYVKVHMLIEDGKGLVDHGR